MLILLKLENGPGNDELQISFGLNVLDFVKYRSESIGEHKLDKLVIANFILIKPTKMFVDLIGDIRSFIGHEFYLRFKILCFENVIKLLETLKIMSDQQVYVSGVLCRPRFNDLVDFLLLLINYLSVNHLVQTVNGELDDHQLTGDERCNCSGHVLVLHGL